MARKRGRLPAVLLALALVLAVSPAASAESYISYTYDAYGEAVPAPESYRTAEVYMDRLYDGIPLNTPEDFFAAPDGRLYICDTGNNRLVILNEDFTLYRTVEAVAGENGEPQVLASPQGVFVTAAGDVYICDTGNGRILVAGPDFVQKKAPLTRPESSLIPESAEFKPQKLVVDTAGSVYVVAYGLYQGLVTYDSEGAFTGFYGSNPVELSLSEQVLLFWKNLFTDEQADVTVQFVPVEFANVYIDGENSVYTATRKTASSLDEIKKLNSLGNNVLRYPKENTLYPANDFGDHGVVIEQIKQIDSRFEDVHVDADGVISALDTQRGRVFQYDQDGNLLFVFGGIEQQKGMFSEPAAVEKLGERYVVLDKYYGSMTVFEPTDYARTVRRATLLYNEGEYAEAQRQWEEVLRRSNYSSLAYRGVGRSLLQQQEYAQAMEYLKKGEDRQGYSEAYKELRKDYIRRYLGITIVALVVGIILISKLLGALLRHWGVLEPRKKKQRRVKS